MSFGQGLQQPPKPSSTVPDISSSDPSSSDGSGGPDAVIVLISACVADALACAVSFGLHVTSQQQTALLTFVGGISALAAAWIHRRV